MIADTTAFGGWERPCSLQPIVRRLVGHVAGQRRLAAFSPLGWRRRSPLLLMRCVKGQTAMRTLTAYGIGVLIVLAILNRWDGLVGNPRLHALNVSFAGFVLGMLGPCISAYHNGYRRVT